MKASIIKIGNSRGIRIPKKLLEEKQLEGNVEIVVRKDGLLIRAAAKKDVYYNDEYLISLPVLAREWDTPEEDAAWAHLQ